MASGTSRTQEVRRLHFFSFAGGVWLIVAPFLLGYSHLAATINSVIVGLIIAALSYVRVRSSNDTWASWGLAGIGLWTVLSPFIFGYSRVATYWNELLVGIALIVIMFSALGQDIRNHSHLAH